MTAKKIERIHSRCDRCINHLIGAPVAADDELREQLNRISHVRAFAKGKTVVAEDDPTSIVGNVISGVLRLVKSTPDGHRQIVGILLPGDMFGRVFADTSHFAIESATNVTLCCFDRKGFESLMSRYPKLEHCVLLTTLEELDAAREWILLLGGQSVMQRVASFLVILARWTERDMKRAAVPVLVGQVKVPINRRDMASYLGTTAESISRSIGALAKKGFIRVQRQQVIDINNYEALLDMSGFADEIAWEISHKRAASMLGQQVAMS